MGDECLLLRFPQELRLKIYRNIFNDERLSNQRYCLFLTQAWPPRSLNALSPKLAAVLRESRGNTDRLLYQEVMAEYLRGVKCIIETDVDKGGGTHSRPGRSLKLEGHLDLLTDAHVPQIRDWRFHIKGIRLPGGSRPSLSPFKTGDSSTSASATAVDQSQGQPIWPSYGSSTPRDSSKTPPPSLLIVEIHLHAPRGGPDRDPASASPSASPQKTSSPSHRLLVEQITGVNMSGSYGVDVSASLFPAFIAPLGLHQIGLGNAHLRPYVQQQQAHATQREFLQAIGKFVLRLVEDELLQRVPGNFESGESECCRDGETKSKTDETPEDEDEGSKESRDGSADVKHDGKGKYGFSCADVVTLLAELVERVGVLESIYSSTG